MRILITSAASQIAQWLAVALRQEHHLRLTERVHIDGDDEFVRCPLDHDFSTNLLVQGMEAIIHVAEPLSGDTAEQQLDYLTRGTYNLLWAAAAEEVRRVVYLSTLELMSHYDESFIITERWRPRPTTSPWLLSKHLGESVCREFAREHELKVVVLRLGQVVQAEAVAGEAFNPMWVDQRDVAQAVTQALVADIERSWSIFHIQADSPQARFPVAQAKRLLGYNPTVSFENREVSL
jgi:nucleoside-diphosphate-sugar epimerase